MTGVIENGSLTNYGRTHTRNASEGSMMTPAYIFIAVTIIAVTPMLGSSHATTLIC